jgi:hypothetical protein
MIYRSMIIMPLLKIKMQTMVRVSCSCKIFVIFDVNIKISRLPSKRRGIFTLRKYILWIISTGEFDITSFDLLSSLCRERVRVSWLLIWAVRCTVIVYLSFLLINFVSCRFICLQF